MDLRADIFRHWERLGNEPHRSHLGASQIGQECPRAVWYGFHWVKKVVFEGRMYRLFEVGNAFEKRMTAELRALGYTVSDETEDGKQHRLGDTILSGSCDGFIWIDSVWWILEYKTHNEKSFKKLEKDGVKKSKPQHYVQMQIYMMFAGLSRALYVAENKNNSDLYFETVEYDEGTAHRYYQLAAQIINGQKIPDRIAKDETFYICGWCDFKEICWKDAVPDVNCRTCINFHKQEGTSMCAAMGSAVTFDQEQTGCGAHVFNPNLVPFEPAHGSREYVMYDNWANCGREKFPLIDSGEPPAVVTSQEMKNCHKFEYIARAAIVKKELGGEIVAGEDENGTRK